MCDKERLLRNLQMIDFALTEVNLYLDTHPHCPEALAKRLACGTASIAYKIAIAHIVTFLSPIKAA